jgi:hypothetical protein
MTPRTLASLTALVLAVRAAPAAAYQGYPMVVDTALGVPQVVETEIAPTMGCQLCHTSNTGGTLTLTAFPSYLISQFGFEKTSSEEDPLLVAALAKLEAAQPKLWADMKAGKDPNLDSNLTALAPPQPQYGCAIRREPTATETQWVMACLGFAIVAAARRRTARRQDRDLY